MGSDLATISVESYREWTRREAISRQLVYGYPADAEDPFFHDGAAARAGAPHAPNPSFAEEGPWLELRLHLRCVHPDAPLDWGHLFLTRLLDEAVYHAARLAADCAVAWSRFMITTHERPGAS